MEVSSKVSIVAAVGSVRRALVKQQQAMGKQKGIVMRKALDSGVLLIRTPWERMAAASHAGLPQAIQSPTTASETVLQCACLQ